MKNIRKAAAICTLILIISLCTPAALAANGSYGADAVEDNQTYTLEQMLNFAIEDEYLAMTRYTAFIQKFGEVRPLTNIASAERAHTAVLKPLFNKYRFPIPENRASQYVKVPGTLLEAYKIGIEGERLNMRMYDIFLRHELPEDVKIIFTVLKNAAANHLQAFERSIARLEGRLPGSSI